MKTNNSKIQSNQRNSLGMSKMVYTQLLAKLESIGENTPDQPAKRQFTRLEYFDPYFELTLDSTKHSQRRKIAVATRNLSRGGMSVLHSSFIYPDTQINATLNKASGEQVKMTNDAGLSIRPPKSTAASTASGTTARSVPNSKRTSAMRGGPMWS